MGLILNTTVVLSSWYNLAEELWSSSLCNIHHPQVTASLLCRSITLNSALLQSTLNLCSSLSGIGQLQKHMSKLFRQLGYCYHGHHQGEMHRSPQESHRSKPSLRVGSLSCNMIPYKAAWVLDLLFSTEDACPTLNHWNPQRLKWVTPKVTKDIITWVPSILRGYF